MNFENQSHHISQNEKENCNDEHRVKETQSTKQNAHIKNCNENNKTEKIKQRVANVIKN